LFQEDFFIHKPVNTVLIAHALGQLKQRGAGGARLYPCPGSDVDYGDMFFGDVLNNTPYRISCQATIWQPEYLLKVLSCVNGSAAAFEIDGSFISTTLPEPMLAFKRDIYPWPVEYLCSGISRGQWNPASKRLCDRLGIENDWTMREMAAR
jgi:hypothetical protein